MLAKPAFKDNNQIAGRAKGGLAIIVPKNMRKYVKLLQCESWRIQPVLLNCHERKCLIINVYFPTDPKTLNGDCLELVDCLSNIATIISSTEFDYLQIAGDLNFEVSRNTSHVRKIKEFYREHNLESLWNEFDVDFTHCFVNENHETFVSTIDHISVLNRSKQYCKEAGVIHHPDNHSDHEVIFAVFDIPDKQEPDAKMKDTGSTPKFEWNNATENQKLDFNDILFRKLMMLKIPECVEGCKNLKCTEQSHTQEIDAYVKELLYEIIESGDLSIPKSKPVVPDKNNKNTPGWNKFVKPFQDKAYFWHSVWISCGRPLNAEIHNVMKRSRNVYHYQVRKCRRVEEYIRNKNIIENCIEGDTDLFAEIKKQRENDDVTIDSAAGKDIPNKFAEVYSNLFNRESDNEEVHKISDDIEDRIDEDSWNEIRKINHKGCLEKNKTK